MNSLICKSIIIHTDMYVGLAFVSKANTTKSQTCFFFKTCEHKVLFRFPQWMEEKKSTSGGKKKKTT